MRNRGYIGEFGRQIEIFLFPVALVLFLHACSQGSDQRSADVLQHDTPVWAYMGQPRPGLTPEIFAEGIVSTDEGIYGTIVFSPDLTEAAWAPEGVPWLLMSRVVGGVWTEPERHQFVDNHGLTSPFYSPDGESLYFLAGPSGSHGEDDDIWVVSREGGGWGEPTRLDPAISAIPTHWQFSLDHEGDLYLMSDGADLYRSEFQGGHYSEPTRIPGPVNTDAPETGPNISPNGEFLLFDRWFDSSPYIRIMVSFRDQSGEWGDPVDLSEALGNEGNDSCARISPDGKFLFFQSVRSGSSPSRSIYWVDASVIDSVRPMG